MDAMPEPSLSAWLALRQPIDFAARNEALTQLVAHKLASPRPLRVLELGTGTGSNIRYLAPRLGGDQEWLAVDKNPDLLEELSASIEPRPRSLETYAMDLGAMDAPDIFDDRHLVTASALLDLVSEEWLAWLAENCHRVGASALFTITYNGTNICSPADHQDDEVFALFNRHQLTDKGLGGRAAGPRATDVAIRCFQEQGYEVYREPSDWKIGPEQADLQYALIDGWANAAIEMAPDRADEIDGWRQNRIGYVARGRSQLIVGHWDIFATPKAE